MKLQFKHWEKTEQKDENIGKKKRLLIVSALIMVPLLGLLVFYIVGLGRYQSCFLNGTVIDMVDVSDMTIPELEGRIGQYSLRVIERQADGTTLEEEIPGSEIGLSYISTEPLQTILQEQNSFLWFVKQDAVYEMEDMLSYDEAALEEKVRGLSGFQKEFIQEPADAYIADYVSGSGFELVAEKPGNRLNRAGRTGRSGGGRVL